MKAIRASARKDRAAVEPAPSGSLTPGVGEGVEEGVGEGVGEGSGMMVVVMTGAVEAANRNWKEPEESEVRLLTFLAMDSAWLWQYWASCSGLLIGRRIISIFLVAVSETSIVHLYQRNVLSAITLEILH